MEALHEWVKEHSEYVLTAMAVFLAFLWRRVTDPLKRLDELETDVANLKEDVANAKSARLEQAKATALIQHQTQQTAADVSYIRGLLDSSLDKRNN